MAHEITSVDAFGEVRSGGKTAWHGLGIEIEDGLTVAEGFDKIGLGWETELGTVKALIGHRADGSERWVECPDHRAHVRLDTEEILGVVSKDYKPIPNKALAEFADSLVGADSAVTLETGGSLRRGKRVFALVKLPKTTALRDADMIRNYICITNAHDGLGAFKAYFTPVRVVCANTFRLSEVQSFNMARFTHDGDIQGKVEEAQRTLGIMHKQAEGFEKMAEAMVGVTMTKKKLDDYFDSVYTATFGKVDEDADATTKLKRTKIVGDWKFNMESNPRNIVKATEGTLWQAYNSVTFYHDHQRGRAKGKMTDTRIHSNLFGISARHKQIALRRALATIS